MQPLRGPLRGSVPLAGDQDVALARMSLAACGRARTTLRFAGEQSGMGAFLAFLELLGVRVEREKKDLHLHGVGLTGAKAPKQAIDLRGEAHAAALALGLLVSRPWPSEVHVDEVVVQLLVPALAECHAMVAEPLRDGGYRVALSPGAIEARPEGLSVVTHGVYPWVKQAILLAGLRAKTPTVVDERLASADHLERAMTRARMPIDVQGTVATVHPPRDDDAVAPQIYDEVGSLSLSVPLSVAALMHESSELTLREVGMNPTRSDWLSTLRILGAGVGVTPRGDRQGEPFGDLSIRSGGLKGVSLGGETIVRLGDGVVFLLAAAARADGPSFVSDLVAHARGGDPKIWGRVVGLLRSAGVEADASDGGVRLQGNGGDPFKPLQTTTGGDARLALLATVLALGATAPSVVDDVDCLASAFPRWVGTLRALGAEIEVRSHA